MNFAAQSFSPSDLGVVAFLILLEGLLSADNALVLAIMVRHLPPEQQKRALLYGLGGAFVFRFLAILFAKKILEFWWLQAVGALYLLYLPIKHFWGSTRPKEAKPVGAGFWPTVVAVEFTDIAFAIDSVLAAVSTVGDRPDKLWVIYLGAIIGIVLLRFAAGAFIKLLERFPVLDHVAYALVAWVGVKLAMMAGHNYHETVVASGGRSVLPFTIPEMSKGLFWGVLMAIAVVGTLLAVKYQRPPGDPGELTEDQERAFE